MYAQLIADFVAREQLPDAYREDAGQILVPLAERLIRSTREKDSPPLLVGVNGAQGTGKSTTCLLLEQLVGAHGLGVANLSIDDFYLSARARQRLAAQCHPLLRSRGVPGTHDTALLRTTVDKLRSARAGERVALPRFDKATDDVRPKREWPVLTAPVDIILLEGWFIAAPPQAETDLKTPVNALEADEDGDGRWRRWVNERLGGDYQGLFQQLDYLIMLRAPSFEQVYQWRLLQEEKLRRKHPAGAPGLMNRQQLQRFIQHFERLTRHCLATLPARADVLLRVTAEHRLTT